MTIMKTMKTMEQLARIKTNQYDAGKQDGIHIPFVGWLKQIFMPNYYRYGYLFGCQIRKRREMKNE